jgi:hypothetical protein
MEDKILTLHPEGKRGVRISRSKYEMIHLAILDAIESQGTATFQGVVSLVEHYLRDRFVGSIPWYVTTVKLDMEARGEIERLPDVEPQTLRIKQAQEQDYGTF